MASSVSVTDGDVTFTCEAGEEATARREVTTTATDEQCSFSFEVRDLPLVLRMGSTSDGSDILPDVTFPPGSHIVSMTPGVSPYYVQFRLLTVGTAQLIGFALTDQGDIELPTPWTESQLASLRYEQSNNTQWWFHGQVSPRVFERRGLNSWSLRKFEPANGPFNPLNLSSVTLTASARTGIATVTASAPIFVEEDAGALLKLTHQGQFETETFSAVDGVTDPIRVQGVGQERTFYYSVSVPTGTASVVLERSIGNELNYVTVSTISSGAINAAFNDGLENQVIFYRFRCVSVSSSVTVQLVYGAGVNDGVGRIKTVEADNEVTVQVLEPFGKTTATSLWYMGAWSARFGYPSTGALFDGRLYVARGNAYWGSAPDDYEDFELTPLADGAIGRTFPGKMSTARWMLPGDQLMVGLAGQEEVIGSNALDEVITPSNVRARPKSNRGSANIAGVIVDKSAVFVGRSKKKLFYWDPESSEAQPILDLTRLNRNISGVTGFSDVAYQVEPEPRIWCVRDDGQVAVHIFSPQERVFAWCRLEFDGTVESICILPNVPEDDVYIVIARTIGGEAKRYVEKLAPEAWVNSSEAWRLHSALAYSGEATSSISGLGHLEGRTDVYVWADGQQAGPFTVSGGSIPNIGFEAEYIIAGLKYAGTYKSPRLNWGGQMGTALTAFKQVQDLGLMIHNTPGGQLAWGRSTTSLERLKDRREGDSFDAPITLWNEDFKAVFEGETDVDPRVHIVMDGAGPAAVLGYVPKVTTKEG